MQVLDEFRRRRPGFGQGGRPSGTSKVQHFPSTTDSEFRRKASRQTRVKKFIASQLGCLHALDGFAVRQRRSGLPRHSVWLFDACNCLLSACPSRLILGWYYQQRLFGLVILSYSRIFYDSLSHPYLFALYFFRLLLVLSIWPSVPFTHVEAPWTTQIHHRESRVQV